MSGEGSKPGSMFGDRYVVEAELGQGGMAIVYRAIDRKHDRPVALKVMRPEISAKVSRERFLREIAIAARLQHPHILALIDSGEANGNLYYVTPYLEGETLEQRITREGRLPIADTLRIATEVVSALRYAHERGVLHRDVKPANIMLTGGHAVVMDFGIAMAMDNTESRLTDGGMAIGTPTYMSPESISGQADARSDVYSAGCVVYEMLAGHPPFRGPNAQAILLQHLAHPVPPLSDTRRDLPGRLEMIVMRALSKEPKERFPTMSAFESELELAVSGAAMAERRGKVVEDEGEGGVSTNLQAYDAYLRGRHSFERRTPKGNRRAITLLEKATDLDPKFASAYAALAAAYIEEFFSHDPDEEWEEKAFAAIEKARALDPRLARVYVAKGNLLWTRARRFPHEQAIQEFKRALAIDPDLVEALNEIGRVYWHIGKMDEAGSALCRALEIDPSSISARFRLGGIEHCRGNFENSLELFSLIPRGAMGATVEAYSSLDLHSLGRTDEARAVLAGVDDALREDADFRSAEAIFCALEGNASEAENKIASAITLGSGLGHFHHVEYNIACARALMGEVDQALAGLRRVAEGGFPCYSWFERDPLLAALRGDARFHELIAELQARWGEVS